MRQTWFESAKAHLTDMERLAFYEVCFLYEFTGEIPTANTCKYGNVLLMFDMVKGDLKADREKAERIAERNAANGAKGGRPRKDNERLQNNENPKKPNETQSNPVETQRKPIHYNIQQHNTMQQAAIGGGGDLDISFFDAQLWPRLNRSGKFNTRHRACCALWEGYSERKRKAITKAVLSDLFAGCENPYFYLEDFQEPTAKYLTGLELEQEMKERRTCYVVIGDDGKQKFVTAADVEEYGLKPERIITPEWWDSRS